MKKIFIDGNYIVVTDENDVELFSAPKSETKVKNSNGSYMLYHETVDQSFASIDIVPAELTDADDVALDPDAITWLRANTGFNSASGGSGAGNLIPDYTDIAGLLAGQGTQVEDGGYWVEDASDDPNLSFEVSETRLQAYYRFLGTATGSIDDYKLISAPYGNKLDNKPLVTPDTGTVITLYPFGNFCNSFIANLEQDEFTFVITEDSDNPAGESATVLIKTDSGASDFPVLLDAEYVEGAPFAVDSYYDLYAWHNGATVAYTFLSRSEPPFLKLTLSTTSAIATWSPNAVTNLGDTLIWNVTGSVTYTDVVVNDPTFNLTGNTGDVVITARNPEDITILSVNYLDITSIDVSDLTELSLFECYGNSLTTLDLSKNTNLKTFTCSGNSLTTLDLSKNTLLTNVNCVGNSITGVDLDQIIIDLNNNGFSGMLTIETGRTSASDVAKSEIIGRGGIVTEY